MLRTFTGDEILIRRLLAVAAFTALTALSAQIEVRIGDLVPFTMQVFVLLLAGMVLGPRDGALSQAAYIVLIRLNLPIAAGGAGATALVGPTSGYLIGFVPAAFVVGWLVKRGADHPWQRWLAGVAGVVVIYTFGLPVLMHVANLSLAAGWAAGVVPFIVIDLVKAALATTLAEGGRKLLIG